jgi:hypothetical protein
MKRAPRVPRVAGVAAVSAALSSLGALGGAGCSLLFHASAAQCATTSDCAARGADFAGLVCVSGSCVPPDAPVDAGDGGDGGDGGTGTPCTHYADCPSTNAAHPEVACDVDRQTCVQLTTEECPFVIGDYQVSMTGSRNPIFVGAFAQLPTGEPQSDVSFVNYALAQHDFAGVGGIPAGPGAGLRTPVFVVCNDQGDIAGAMAHLVSDVHVPAVIAALSSKVLGATFSNVNLTSSSDAPKVFFMNPFGADRTLTSLPTAGLLWHMLGQPSDLVPAYQALFPRVEAHVRAVRGLDPGAPMKVATVTPQSTLPIDLNGAVNPALTWTGGPATAQNTANYLDVELSASTLDALTIAQIDVKPAVSKLVAFQPDVVLSYGSEEVINLIETFELTPGSTRPFYVLGPYNTGSTILITWIGNLDSRRTRFVGINYAATQDNPVLAAYQQHFLDANPTGVSDQGDNYYDAAYFTLYALVAAGRAGDLTGKSVALGMPHLVYTDGTPYDVGPTAISGVLTALTTLGTTGIGLVDTIGPPQFNNTTGARITPGDVYCINRNTQASPDGGLDLTPYYDYDVLTPRDAGPDAVPPALEGTYPCYDGF